MPNPTCSVHDCDREPVARDWCTKHYQRWQRHGDPLTQIEIQGDDHARFWSKALAEDGPLRCWLWTDTLNEDGYGRFREGRASKLAHRVAWEYLRGAIPEGLVIDHECRVRECVNPWHLDPVPPGINSRRGAWWLDEDMCKHGHRYTPANERYNSANGFRYCLDCIRDSRRRRRAVS